MLGHASFLSILALAALKSQATSIPAIADVIHDSGLQDWCQDYIEPDLVKRAGSTVYVTSRVTRYATRTAYQMCTQTNKQVVSKTTTVVQTQTISTTIAPPARRKRSLGRHAHDLVLAKRTDLPGELQGFPTASVSQACAQITQDPALHKRARRAVTSTRYTTVTSTRTVTSCSPVVTVNQAITTTVPVTRTTSVVATCTAAKPTKSAYSSLMSQNGINIGMLPDWGEGGRPRTTMAQLNGLVQPSIGNKFATFGYYSQAYASSPYDGAQLIGVMSDVIASGAIFEPVVMPISSWAGFTYANNSQAINVCNVMKQFTDAGVQVRLRFAHEANWYVTDGTYAGGASDFKQAWAVVAAACKQIAPQVAMFWTPNIDSASAYATWAPDLSTVQYVGVDYYPKQASSLSSWVSTMQSFHNTYASASRPFAIGETGLGYAGSASDRITWFKSIIASKSQLPYTTSISWFNYIKEWNYRIVDPTDSTVTNLFIKAVTGC